MENDKNLFVQESEQNSSSAIPSDNAKGSAAEQSNTELPRRQSRVEVATKRRKRNRFITLLCVLAAVELAACLIPFNIIDTAIPLSLALIPTVIAGIICGPALGSLIGFAGGLFSIIIWSTPLAINPAVAFVYSPFVSGGAFGSVAISIIPYTLAGTIAGIVHMGIIAAQNRKKAKQPETETKWYAPAVYAISASVACIVSILLVLAGISMFFPNAFSADVLAGIFLLKGVVEAIFACLIAVIVCYPVLKIKALKEKSDQNKEEKSKKKQKDDSHKNNAEQKDK